MLSEKTMRRNLIIFLVLSSVLLLVSACGSAPAGRPLDLNWELVQRPDGMKACLAEPDVAKLREALIRCQPVAPEFDLEPK